MKKLIFPRCQNLPVLNHMSVIAVLLLQLLEMLYGRGQMVKCGGLLRYLLLHPAVFVVFCPYLCTGS